VTVSPREAREPTCDICKRVIRGDEHIYYECPDGLPGHDWLECGDCHFDGFGDAASLPVNHKEPTE
jgi:hypothetical protein